MELPCAETLALPRGPATVKWRRSARARCVSLRIDARGGAVVVTLPPGARRRAGMALLTDHADWISEQLAALPGRVALADGAMLKLQGRLHRIRQVGGGAGCVRIEGREIRCSGPAEAVPKMVGAFLRAEAQRRFSALALKKAAMAGLSPKRVVVKDTRSRWASCAADGTLAFSWRLLMAPGFVQESVVAHEVAHLRHMHHGPDFWELAHRLSSHAGRAAAWLARNGPGLLRVG